MINARCSLRIEAGERVIVVAGLPVHHYRAEDAVAEAYAMVFLVELGFAQQTEAARAFGQVSFLRSARWLRPSAHVDVTERERAQDEHERLRQLESDLAHMNRLSTMGVLTASLAHEITQPITGARNNARAAWNFLDRQPPDLGEVREALGSVVGDTDRAREIIDRIRDHIKKAPPRKHSFDLNEAINEVIALARSAITENRVAVQTRLAEGLIPVQGDRVQLQQVVLNLILNAVEAMSSVEAGARKLLITTEQNQTDDVLVAVRDFGPGIHPEYLERVFEAFYTTKSSGVRMGLSICRSIIDAHGGRLWADVNEPRGAVFQLTLPSAEKGNHEFSSSADGRAARRHRIRSFSSIGLRR